MLLLHDPTTKFDDISAQEIQEVIDDYIAWRDKIAADGILTGGEKLGDDGGKHLRADGGKIRVTDGPYAEVKENIAGFFSITADDYDSAVTIAKSCPHLKYGGWIELREIHNH